MAYTPTEWKTGDVITAEKLNNMEQGIVNNEEVFIIHATGLAGSGNPHTQPTLDKTYEEIASAYNAGKILAVIGDVDDVSGITLNAFLPFINAAELQPGNLAYTFGLNIIAAGPDKANLVMIAVNVMSSGTMSAYQEKYLAYTT